LICDFDAEDLAVPICSDPGNNQDGLVDLSTSLSDFQIRGIDDEVDNRLLDRAIQKLMNMIIKLGSHPGNGTCRYSLNP